MKKMILGALIGGVVTAFFCSTVKAQGQVVVNREVQTDEDGAVMLGRQTLSQFYKAPYDKWFNEEYDSYVVDKKAIEQLRKEKLGSYRLTVYVGSWCPDTHREFPRLIKILQDVHYPMNKLEIIALSRKKESPDGTEVMNHIKDVPTIIVEKYGREWGRIIESPDSGFLGRDLLEIIQKGKNLNKQPKPIASKAENREEESH